MHAGTIPQLTAALHELMGANLPEGVAEGEDGDEDEDQAGNVEPGEEKAAS